MAACTSRAAASMFLPRSNCKVMEVVPRKLVDVISVSPAMRPNWRSSGVATEEAMVSGLAPGRAAFTPMVGNSTCGIGEGGRAVDEGRGEAHATWFRATLKEAGRLTMPPKPTAQERLTKHDREIAAI